MSNIAADGTVIWLRLTPAATFPIGEKVAWETIEETRSWASAASIPSINSYYQKDTANG